MKKLNKEIQNEELVGIISYNIHSNLLNYGAALHSYAFQQYLDKLYTPSVIVDYIPVHVERRNLKYPLFNLRKMGGGFNHHFMNFAMGARKHVRKFRKFQDFFKKHTAVTPGRYTWNRLKKSKDIDGLKFRTFVAESDVTWKSYWEGDFDHGFYLDFPAAENTRKVAYAPSLSAKPFSENDEKKFKDLVKDFSAICTREHQGAEYLTGILGKDIDWCLDPTLLLDAEDYRRIAVNPEEKGYVLMYNCMVNDRAMIREAEKFAAAKGLELIEISNFNENSYRFNHTVKTDVGIEEWLGYFDNADYVICNAFHGFCFSVVFSKQVILFERDGSDFRMRNITGALNAPHCMIPYDNKMIPEELSGRDTFIDYEDVYSHLETLRKKSHEFIKEHISR